MIFLLIFAVRPVSGAEKIIIYLAPNGLGTNPGKKEKPLASLPAARDLIRELYTRDTILAKIEPDEIFLRNVKDEVLDTTGVALLKNCINRKEK